MVDTGKLTCVYAVLIYVMNNNNISGTHKFIQFV